MKAFGLELRRIGDVTTLYHDVDRVLRQNNITAESVGGVVQKNTVAHMLHKMMQTDARFDVCGIRECATLCGLVIPKQRMLIYSAMHCVHWNEMTPEYRQTLCAMVLDDFRAVLTATPTDPSTR